MTMLQNLLLKIAEEIQRICLKYQIDIFMDGGTQLGAVRHQGFIPWDDDLDFAMRRKDYELFLKVCEKELNPDLYFLHTGKTEKYYPFEFAKIQLVGTEILEDFSKNADVHHGIFVDIFPYDELPMNTLERKMFLYKNLWLKNILWVKCGYGSIQQHKKITYRIFALLGVLFSVEGLKKSRYKLITKYQNSGSTECFTSDYPKVILKTKWFEKKMRYQFEASGFYGFEAYDDFLTALYGDYLIIPPPEKRISHSYYEIDYGPY